MCHLRGTAGGVKRRWSLVNKIDKSESTSRLCKLNSLAAIRVMNAQTIETENQNERACNDAH
jgi:hypothetical protein